MKRLFLATIVGIAAVSCQNVETETQSTAPEVQYQNYGDSTFAVDEAVSAAAFVAQFEASGKDTLWATIEGPITQVCEAKGCWMSTAIDTANNLFVDYDYEFLLPTNSQGQSMVMHGYGYFDTTSVAQLHHYAQDRGASEEEIAAITEPKVELLFKATGVKIVLPEGQETAEVDVEVAETHEHDEEAHDEHDHAAHGDHSEHEAHGDHSEHEHGAH